MKTYVEISVEKELPKEHGWHLMCNKELKKPSDAQWSLWHPMADGSLYNASSMPYEFKYFLREFSLPELMEEYTEWYNEWSGTQANIDKGHPELINEFLKIKGIL